MFKKSIILVVLFSSLMFGTTIKVKRLGSPEGYVGGNIGKTIIYVYPKHRFSELSTDKLYQVKDYFKALACQIYKVKKALSKGKTLLYLYPSEDRKHITVVSVSGKCK